MATGESSTPTATATATGSASRTGSVRRERLGGRTSGGSRITRDGSARAMVNDQISQAVVSTSNLIHLMLQSSPSQAHLIKLPKNLLAKTSTIKNTEQVLEQLPKVVASLDAHMESGLQSVPHLKTVTQLLTNIETCQLNSLSKAQLSSGDPEQVHQPGGAG